MNRRLSILLIHIGTVNQSIAVPRDILKPVLLSNGSRLLIAHNHPSGCPEPSKQDMLLTKRVKEAGNLLGIELLDHLIISDGTYYSFKEENQL
ncbi:JAB domain-containing protein [Vagococcus fluvialis]|uniref:JAB domain-containing protein n=1 Tax=Vagococcus fluvialis TaxID=2738 RepID=UPI001F31217C|nr:JAB domain-containing protein [Vagococcus fluvialis]